MTDEEQRDLMQEERIAHVLRRRVRDTSVPPFSAVEARLRRPMRVAPILLTAAGVTVLALTAGTALGDRRVGVGTPATPTPSPAAPTATARTDARPTPLPTARPTAAAGTPVTVCGTLVDYRAPTSSAIGSVTVGEERFFVATDAQTRVAPGVAAGAVVCLEGRWVAEAAGRSLTLLVLRPQASDSASPARSVVPSPRSTPRG